MTIIAALIAVSVLSTLFYLEDRDEAKFRKEFYGDYYDKNKK